MRRLVALVLLLLFTPAAYAEVLDEGGLIVYPPTDGRAAPGATPQYYPAAPPEVVYQLPRNPDGTCQRDVEMEIENPTSQHRGSARSSTTVEIDDVNCT